MSLPGIADILADLQKRDIIKRIWQKDHTVWSPDPSEIANRLGWLTVADQMKREVTALTSFADEIRSTGFTHVVLLGMGGASLGAEVLRQTFGRVKGYPELIVLDSTVPDRIISVTRQIDLLKTLFIVASKSGGTIETLSLYKHFRNLVEQTAGKNGAGLHFIVITDAGSSLEKLAKEAHFRRAFLNPADIGGRYSVLSYFGLVPAALAGIDITELLSRASAMSQACHSPLPGNPGGHLGALIGGAALKGQDKLTLITSPALDSFGLWLEQLIAESTGKEGRGIIPVIGEPLVDAAYYGDDRTFVYLRLKNDRNDATDKLSAQLKISGREVTMLDLTDRFDLGAEFFRWEFATAVAGALLGINPFDQPDVQATKDVTMRMLQEYHSSGKLPAAPAADSLKELLQQAKTGRYFAIMTYLNQTPDIDRAIADLRKKLVEKYRIATTLGYGPRFLHSTGQLHKGGPNGGLFLQLTADVKQDVPIPGDHYTFRVLAEAQASGDFQTLKLRGRTVIRVHLGADPVTAIKRLSESI